VEEVKFLKQKISEQGSRPSMVIKKKIHHMKHAIEKGDQGYIAGYFSTISNDRRSTKPDVSSDDRSRSRSQRRGKRGSVNGFNLFVADLTRCLNKTTMEKKIRKLAALWKALPADKRSEYTERAKAENRRRKGTPVKRRAGSKK